MPTRTTMAQPPLSIIIPSPPNHCVPDHWTSTSSIQQNPAHTQSAPNTSRSKQQVDPTSCSAADMIALLLAEKHESNPSTLKMSEFSETLDLKSASSWNKFSLALCGVEFDRTTYTELRTLIKDPRWYDPTTETEAWEFVER